MHDQEEALDAKLLALIVRLHQLRVCLQSRAPKALVDWEILHEQLDILNDARIRLILQAEETGVDEWIAMSDLANTINKECDQLESHLRLVKSTPAPMYLHIRLHEVFAQTS